VPEIVDGGGRTVSPDDVEALSDEIESALFDDELRRRLSRAGRERGRQFSWKKTARSTLQILDEAAR
jgi:glycosyltransferase involved in cell wall biosynthesis